MSGRLNKPNQPSVSALPEIGKIKIGEKGKTAAGVEYPKALDYFRVTGKFSDVFDKIYGAKPQKINIAFISDNLSEVCNQRYECWEGGRHWGWSEDGDLWNVWDPTKGDLVKQKDEKAPPKHKGAYVTIKADTEANIKLIKSAGKWEEMLTLRFVILDMKGILGYWRFETKAKVATIPQIISSFDFVRARAGTIIGFPFSLVVEKHISMNPGEARSYPVVTLVPNFSEESMLLVSEYIQAGGQLNKLTSKVIEQEKVMDLLPKQLS